MNSFATPADLADRLQQPDPGVFTATAQQLLAGASDTIRSYTGQTINLVTDDQVSLLGDGIGVLELPQRPVVSVASVSIDGTAVTDFLLRGSMLYRATGGLWSAISGLPDWFSNAYPSQVTVVYTHGYDTIPDAVKAVCLNVAQRAYANPAGNRSEAETIGSYSHSTTVGGDAPLGGLYLTEEDRRALRPFRRMVRMVSLS